MNFQESITQNSSQSQQSQRKHYEAKQPSFYQPQLLQKPKLKTKSTPQTLLQSQMQPYSQAKPQAQLKPYALSQAKLQAMLLLPEVQAEQQKQIQIQMLVQECQEFISKIFTPTTSNVINNQQLQGCFYDQNNNSILSHSMQHSSFNGNSHNVLKQDKSRLEQEYLDLCIEIERQQKQLENYKFKIQVAHKEADYYSRQIKEKEEILNNLEKHREDALSSSGGSALNGSSRRKPTKR